MNPSPDSTPAQAADPATDAPHSARASASEVRTSAPRLALTDFLDVESLQDVQDGFTAVTRLSTSIRDAEGNRVTSPTDATHRAQSDFLLEQLIEAEEDADGCYTAPLLVAGQVLASLAIDRPTRKQQMHIRSRGRLSTVKFGQRFGQSILTFGGTQTCHDPDHRSIFGDAEFFTRDRLHRLRIEPLRVGTEMHDDRLDRRRAQCRGGVSAVRQGCHPQFRALPLIHAAVQSKWISI